MALSDYTNEYDGAPKPLVAVAGTPSVQTPFGKVDASEVIITVNGRNLVDILAELQTVAPPE